MNFTLPIRVPSVRMNQEQRTTIIVAEDSDFIHHIPMSSEGIAVWHTDPIVFKREYPLLALEHGWGYRPSRAAQIFIEATHLPKSGAAMQVLQKVAAHQPVVKHDLHLQVTEEQDMAGKKAVAAKKSTGEKKGRAAKYSDDMRITVKEKENPKRGESAKRFGYYKTGMSVAEYIKKGGLRGDIAWDVEKGYIGVR